MDPWSENSRYLIDLITYYFNYGKSDSINFGRKNMNNDIQKSIYYAFLEQCEIKVIFFLEFFM